MRFEIIRKHDRTGERVKISPVSADEQNSRVHEAVAQRAYQISEMHKGAIAQETQDWLQAESEIIHPCCAGRMPLDGSLWLGTDANVFEEGTIEIWVAPRQLTVCGEPQTGSQAICSRSSTRLPVQMVYEVIELPLDVDPASVTAKVNSSALEIFLGKEALPERIERKRGVAA